jgi:hypothetical protein
MTRARNHVFFPLWLFIAAGVVLIALLGRTQIVLAPAPNLHPATLSAPAADVPQPVQARSNSSSTLNTEQAVTWIGTSAPLAPPAGTTQPAAPLPPEGPGPAHCPAPADSGLPCVKP